MSPGAPPLGGVETHILDDSTMEFARVPRLERLKDVARATVREAFELDDGLSKTHELVDLDKVSEFCAARGLLRPADVPVRFGSFKELSRRGAVSSEMGAAYNPSKGVIGVSTNTADLLRGAGLSDERIGRIMEAGVVHELTHASAVAVETSYARANSATPHSMRVGYGITKYHEGHSIKRGKFFEEARAETFAMDYIEAHPLPGEDLKAQAHAEYKGKALVFPGSQRDWLNMGAISTPSLAAAGMRWLSRYDPVIGELMQVANPTVEDQRALVNHMEALQPGLFGKLRQVPYTLDGFLEGYLLTDEVYLRLRAERG